MHLQILLQILSYIYFVTGHPSDQQLPSRNIAPYNGLPIYRVQGQDTVMARTQLFVSGTRNIVYGESEVITVGYGKSGRGSSSGSAILENRAV